MERGREGGREGGREVEDDANSAEIAPPASRAAAAAATQSAAAAARSGCPDSATEASRRDRRRSHGGGGREICHARRQRVEWGLGEAPHLPEQQVRMKSRYMRRRSGPAAAAAGISLAAGAPVLRRVLKLALRREPSGP